MKLAPPENKKYINKFGMTKSSSIDWHKESLRPQARCTFCIKQYGDAPKHDLLTIEYIRGVYCLCCSRHRK